MVATDATVPPMPEEPEDVKEKRAIKEVKVLEGYMDEYDKLEEEYQKKWADLQAEYDKKQSPLIVKRTEFLKGKADKETEETKKTGTPKIPNFWLEGLKHLPAIQEDIEEWDEPVLAYLVDIRKEDLPDSSGLNQAGFKLIFEFDADKNEYFENKTLTRVFHTKKDNEFVNEIILDKVVFEEEKIEWKPKKDVTVELMQKKAKRGGAKKKAMTLKEEPKESFFRKFFRTIDVQAAEAKDVDVLEDLDDLIRFSMGGEEYHEDEEDADEILEMLFDQAYEMGCCLRDNIVPSAVRWYTGQAAPRDGFFEMEGGPDMGGPDDDDEDEEGEDGDDSEADELEADDSDSDEDEDEKEKKAKKKAAGGKKDKDGKKVNTEECKQQ